MSTHRFRPARDEAAGSSPGSAETPELLVRYFGQIARGDLLVKGRELELARRARDGDRAARGSWRRT